MGGSFVLLLGQGKFAIIQQASALLSGRSIISAQPTVTTVLTRLKASSKMTSLANYYATARLIAKTSVAVTSVSLVIHKSNASLAGLCNLNGSAKRMVRGILQISCASSTNGTACSIHSAVASLKTSSIIMAAYNNRPFIPYHARGLIRLRGCGKLKIRNRINTKFILGATVYSIPAAKKGCLEKVVINQFDIKNNRATAGKNVILYVDTLNGLWNENELCGQQEAIYYALGFLNRQNARAAALACSN